MCEVRPLVTSVTQARERMLSQNHAHRLALLVTARCLHFLLVPWGLAIPAPAGYSVIDYFTLSRYTAAPYAREALINLFSPLSYAYMGGLYAGCQWN